MDTIYSEIIWKQLGLKDYKIHEESSDKTDGLIISWVKDTSLEKVDQILFKGFSWIDRVTNEGYYDGPFYGFSQREKDKQYKSTKDNPEADIVIHDCGILPTIFHMAAKTRMAPSELVFISNLLEAYYGKLPKDKNVKQWNNMEEGEEI